ncbi:hypothetical protein CR513_34215, partial [Mucuna pruriens]
MILGQPTLNRLRSVVSIPHLCMKYPIIERMGMIYADRHTARWCYEASLKVGGQEGGLDNQRDKASSSRPLFGSRPLLRSRGIQTLSWRSRLVPAHYKNHNGWISSYRSGKQLICFLLDNRDAFVWLSEDMSRIDPNFFYHWLSIALGMQLGEEKRKVVKEEMTKLLEARFIIRYPSWLANVVNVKKA